MRSTLLALSPDRQSRIGYVFNRSRSRRRINHTDKLNSHTVLKRVSEYLDSNLLLRIKCVDGDRILRRIRELEVRSTPCDSGIRAGINIGARPRVRLTQINLEICLYNAVKKHSIRLADATAKFLPQRTVVNASGLTIALVCRSLSNEIIEIERFTGLEHQTIYRLTYQSNVRVTISIPSRLRSR